MLDRLRAAIRAFKLYRRPLAVIFEEDIFISAMKRRLLQYFPIGTQNELLLHDICEAVFKELKGLENKTTLEAASGLENELIILMIQKYCLISGVAAAWELEMKFFAAKVGVDVYNEVNEGEHIETRPTSKLVKQILARFPQIDAKLNECLDIRNGLIHGNLQQLKVTISQLLTPSELKDIDSKMAVVSLNPIHTGNVRMAKESFTKEEAKALGPFFWFLSGGNSRLLDRASEILEKGLRDMRTIISVCGLSFEETKGYFEQLAIEGKPWTAEQRKIFTEKRGSLLPVKQGMKEEEIIRIHGLFKLKN